MGDFYLQKQREMDLKFRDVVVMMEVGKFYEVYTFEDPGGESVGRARDVSRVCNIILTRKNKNLPPSVSNPYMCGFPSHSLARYVRHLVAHGHTVAVYEQQPQAGDRVERVLKGVYSPSVLMGDVDDDTTEDEDRCVLALSIDKQPSLVGDWCYTVAHVCISTTSGQVSCEEDAFAHEHEAVSFVAKLLGVYAPKEVLARSCVDVDWTSNGSVVVHDLPSEKKYTDNGFQEIVLGKVFGGGGNNISVVEAIGLERHPDLVAVLTHAVCFLEEHHPLAVCRLRKPTFLRHSDHVSCNTHTFYDLNIFRHGGNGGKPLHEVLDATQTPAGRRLFRRLLFSPHSDVEALERSYDEVEALMPLLDQFQLRKKVGFHGTDVEHVLRKLETGSAGVPAVFRFFRVLFDFDDMISSDVFPRHLAMAREWQAARARVDAVRRCVEGVWDMALMQSWRSWESDAVWRETPQVLRAAQSELDAAEVASRKWVEAELGPFQRLVFGEEEAYFGATKKMHAELKDKEGVRVRLMSSTYRIYHPRIDAYFHERKRLLRFIVRTRREVFQQQVAALVEAHDDTLVFMVRATARVDVALSNAANAARFRLQRPKPSGAVGIGLKCCGLRHLLVEVATPDVQFVANSVDLTDHHGVLLFGQNSAGKCFREGTEVVLWDGQLRRVEELVLGDRLVGDDGTPRKILALTNGSGPLYDIVRADTQEVIMTVNEEHILCLTDLAGTNFVEVPLKSVLQKPYKYAGMMHQYTRGVVAPANAAEELVVERQYFMNDDEWRKIYLSFLHCGRRIRYSHDRLVMEPTARNIVPFVVRLRTREGRYFGFGLDGNEHFLLPCGNVSHNSTLMKSLGVSVLMAQCGMFVPCASMEWSPVRSLFTKIGNRDDIWRGKSTFITEMSELRHILERADDRSLVLCDELTSGTESFSASGILAGTLESLLEKKSKFIVTTHLHTLKQFDALLAHPRLRVMHFGMTHDKENKKLVFDRVLREGSGKSIYGLEIAEYLGFPPSFLKRAYEYRSQLDPKSVPLKPKRPSRYNKKKWVDACEECGATTDLHTHHVLPQKDADADGFIGSYHKNKLSNLRILCHPCHDKEHHHHHH